MASVKTTQKIVCFIMNALLNEAICLHVVSRVWSKLKDTTIPKKAAFYSHTAALLNASAHKFKVECSHTYLIPATRDLIYDVLKPTEGLISTKEHRFSKDKKILLLQHLLGTNFSLSHICAQARCHEDAQTHSPLWSEADSPGEHVKWFGGGMLERRLNEFISITVWTGLNGRERCLMWSCGSDCCQEAEYKRQPVRLLPCWKSFRGSRKPVSSSYGAIRWTHSSSCGIVSRKPANASNNILRGPSGDVRDVHGFSLDFSFTFFWHVFLR